MIPTAEPIRVAVPRAEFWDSRHRWQVEAFRAFDKAGRPFGMLKWHRRARKTTLLVNLLIREAIRNPKRTYLYIGPTQRQARKTVWTEPTMLFHWLPDRNEIGWEANKTEATITFDNGAVLGIEGSDNPDSIRGFNPAGVVIDEFPECAETLWPAIIQPIMREGQGRWCWMGFTPKGADHAKHLWDATENDLEWFHMVLRASESRLISAEALDAARRTTPAWMFDQEYECSDITDEEMVLITSALIESLQGVQWIGVEGRKRVVAYDPNASLTGDRSVVYYIENGRVLDEDIFWERDPLKGAARAMLMGERHQCEQYAVDWTGIGTGVCGKLSELGKQVWEYIAAGKAARPEVANVRAEAYWLTMLAMMDKRIPYPEGFESAPALREELSAVRAKPGKLIKLEQKADVKKRLGRSPDHADAYVIGQWAMDYVPTEYEDVPLEPFRQPAETDIAGSYTVETVL